MYVLRYVFAWLLTLCFLASCLLALGTVASQSQSREWTILLTVVSLSMGLLYLLTTHQRSYLRWRTGALWGGGWLFSAPSATSEQTIEKVLFMRRRGFDIEPVGGGWSNVLRREPVVGKPLYTEFLRGKTDVGRSRWLAGTPLKEVHEDLRKRGLVLVNLPSYAEVTVGAWVATLGHGMPGRIFDHALVSVSALVLDVKTGVVSFDGPSKLLDKFGRSKRRALQFLVLEVELTASPSMVTNSECIRSSRWLLDVSDAQWLLEKAAAVAVVFVGRSGSLALRWTPLRPGQRRPTRGIRRRIDDASYALFSVSGRFPGNPHGREHTQKLSDAIYLFSVYLWPIYTFFFLLLPLRNVELYTSDLDLSPEKLLEVTERLHTHYQTYNGRCEVRFLGGLTFFDCFSWSDKGLCALTEVLTDMGVQRAALHPGKFQPKGTESWSLELVEPAAMV